jgi:hypothetical protein
MKIEAVYYQKKKQKELKIHIKSEKMNVIKDLETNLFLTLKIAMKIILSIFVLLLISSCSNS